MLKELAKVANKLDHLGLTKEADFIDGIISKFAEEESAGNPLSDALLDEQLNYIVPVKVDTWSWVTPTSWRYREGEETESNVEGIMTSARMAAFLIKKDCEERGASLQASKERFLELARESLAGYLQHVSDKEAYVRAAEAKAGRHMAEFKKACDSLVAEDKAREEGMQAYEKKIMESGGMSSPF